MDVVQFIFDLIFQPGSSLRLIPAINVTVLLLIGLLIVAGLYSEVAKIHFLIMSFLAFGLLISVNWFYLEFQKALKEKENNEGTTAAAISNKKDD